MPGIVIRRLEILPEIALAPLPGMPGRGGPFRDSVLIAKSIFQFHGADAQGRTIVKRRIRRHDLLAFFEELPACLVGMEACSSAHHWAWELAALGHDVRLIPPQYAKPCVKRNKTDAADAESICEASQRLATVPGVGPLTATPL